MSSFNTRATTWKLAIGMGLLVATSAANAQLAGTQVNGSLQFSGSGNYFDPANGFVPSGYGNKTGLPVTINSSTEFGFNDGSNLDTANFTDTQLIVGDVVSTTASSWEMQFTTLSPGAFGGLSLVSSNFTGLTYNLMGDTITITWGGTSRSGTYQATFDLLPAAVPEPATWAMMLIGFAAIGISIRRREIRSARIASVA